MVKKTTTNKQKSTITAFSASFSELLQVTARQTVKQVGINRYYYDDVRSFLCVFGRIVAVSDFYIKARLCYPHKLNNTLFLLTMLLVHV